MVAGALPVALFVTSGLCDVGAEVPHGSVTARLLEIARERSVRRSTAHVEVPLLDDPKRVAAGAKHYAAMCVRCRLAPGAESNGLRAGLYPQPRVQHPGCAPQLSG